MAASDLRLGAWRRSMGTAGAWATCAAAGGVRTGPHKQLRHRPMAGLGGVAQRQGAPLVGSLDLRTALDKELDLHPLNMGRNKNQV